MTSSALSFTQVSKKYGRSLVIDHLSFDIPVNSVCAFIGANGAGKTTSFALAGGFLRPAGGEIKLLGQPLKSCKSLVNLLGVLPQDANLYEDIPIAKQLALLARLQNFSGSAARKEAQRVLELCSLTDKAHSTPGDLSRGMKVRLGMAQALLGNPKVLLLDEPTAGLDPMMQQSFYKTINELRGKVSIVISSHNLFELEELCDYAVFINSGKLVKQGSLHDLRSGSSQVIYRFANPLGDLDLLQKTFPELQFKLNDPNSLEVIFDTGKTELAEVNQQLLAHFVSRRTKLLTIEATGALRQLFSQ